VVCPAIHVLETLLIISSVLFFPAIVIDKVFSDEVKLLNISVSVQAIAFPVASI
jgi:hypothetical protein